MSKLIKKMDIAIEMLQENSKTEVTANTLIGRAIRKLREDRNNEIGHKKYTQASLGKGASIHQQRFSKIEAGKVPVRLVEVLDICRILAPANGFQNFHDSLESVIEEVIEVFSD